MLRMWFFTVFSEMYSSLAMSRLLWPLATSLRTSISRSVNLGVGSCCFSSARLTMLANSSSSLEAIDGELLQQVAVRTRLDGVVEVRLLIGDGQHQDLGMGDEVLDGLCRFDASPPRHANVHQDDIGHELLGLLDGLGAIAGLAHDLDIVFLLENHLEPATEQCVVVHDQHADGVSCARRS